MRLIISRNKQNIDHAKQRGVVLLITLIVLVAMTLAAIALMRSVDTTNIIAGNLAFQRSTILAADAGIEAAVAPVSATFPNGGALLQIVSNKTLDTPCTGNPTGYKSFYEPNLDPPNQSWDAFWNSHLPANGGCAATLPANPNAPGISVSYIIERLCSPGTPASCMQSPPNAQAKACIGANQGNPKIPCPPVLLKYYRVTAHAEGPRNTSGYVQVIVAM